MVALFALRPPRIVVSDIEIGNPTMNANCVYSLLDDACRALDAAEEHAIAAHVGFAMDLIQGKYDVQAHPVDEAARD